MATWGSGKPVIALGSDVDCIPQASQKPGVAYKDPIVVSAPGHGEGHNSGIPLNILAVLAVKDIMQKNHMSGTRKVWPGIAEELHPTLRTTPPPSAESEPPASADPLDIPDIATGN